MTDPLLDYAARARAAQQAVNDLGAGPPGSRTDPNELMAAGAIWACLRDPNMAEPRSAEPMLDENEEPTNAIHVRFGFLRSRYRVTVTLDPEEGDPR